MDDEGWRMDMDEQNISEHSVDGAWLCKLKHIKSNQISHILTYKIITYHENTNSSKKNIEKIH